METPTYVPLQPSTRGLEEVSVSGSQKTAMSAVIVVVSIIAVVLVAVVTWYFIQDPWEYPASTTSTINRDYYKEQYSYYSWSPSHQAPYLLLHLFASSGNVMYVPQAAVYYKEDRGTMSVGQYAPLFQLEMQYVGDMVGVSRLRKKGVVLSMFDVLEQWNRQHFFPDIEKQTINKLSSDTKCLPSQVTHRVSLGNEKVPTYLSHVPFAYLSFLYQNGPSSTKELVGTHMKLISVNVDRLTHCIILSFIIHVGNSATQSFFQRLINDSHNSAAASVATADIFHCYQIECNVYNPQWARTVFAELDKEIFTWN